MRFPMLTQTTFCAALSSTMQANISKSLSLTWGQHATCTTLIKISRCGWLTSTKNQQAMPLFRAYLARKWVFHILSRFTMFGMNYVAVTLFPHEERTCSAPAPTVDVTWRHSLNYLDFCLPLVHTHGYAKNTLSNKRKHRSRRWLNDMIPAKHDMGSFLKLLMCVNQIIA